ncbi:putative MFS-type transporter C409,08 [Rhizoctonia solani AG-1 IB]|uniref:Putative MFS-type transporter C409,08 n=1 Tax=Thanatephorus cucumeris (strain AG1-IB / isolate 7/3/14) TaxID=1108050 RepID=M5C9U7_THACB|nr:putative MFS-type transporter C409,08 [Rhizoctonia solani AG-1 IB]
MAQSTDRNSRSDVESTAPTIVDDTRSKNDPGDVDQVIAPGEESAKQITDEKADSFLVQWDGPDDPANPKNWSRPFRWYITALGGVAVLNATFASSAPSGIEGQLIREFNLSTIGVASLDLRSCQADANTFSQLLFLPSGSLVCYVFVRLGPLSENYGRRRIFLIGFVVYTAFQIGGALAPNIASVLVFVFLGGTFAACPLTNSGAIIADIWDADTRGKALAIFTLAPFAGPALGLTVAGYMSVAGVSWVWLFGVLSTFYLVYYNPIYTKYIKEFAPRPIPPEYRLDMALLANPLCAASFFWFGYIDILPIHILFRTGLSGALSWFTIVLLFLSLFNYIIDTYLMCAASALAISTVVRPSFDQHPGAMAAAATPIPFVLKKYGAQVQHKSKYAPL